MSASRQNIIFSTTRQWNPGDEFILQGVRKIFDKVGIAYNPVIYNRHPDIRSQQQHLQIFKTSKVSPDFLSHEPSRFLEANVKFGFFDNSVKPDTNCSFADWVVLAGTPEWCNGRMTDLYSLIAQYNLPVMILGVGGGYHPYKPAYQKVFKHAKTFTVRDKKTLAAVRQAGLQARYLPCPAFLGGSKSQERYVQSVKKIGLIYQAAVAESVIWNGFAEGAYASMMKLYHKVLAQFKEKYEFEIVCHYIDEMPLVQRDFPDLPVRYSYDAAEYFDIYGDYDFVIGPRVHGIGAAASVGVPGIALSHDSRGSTCEGFLADVFTDLKNIPAILSALEKGISEVAARSRMLAEHKEETMKTYVELVGNGLADKTVAYDAPELIQPVNRYSLKDFDQVFRDWVNENKAS